MLLGIEARPKPGCKKPSLRHSRDAGRTAGGVGEEACCSTPPQPALRTRPEARSLCDSARRVRRPVGTRLSGLGWGAVRSRDSGFGGRGRTRGGVRDLYGHRVIETSSETLQYTCNVRATSYYIKCSVRRCGRKTYDKN